MGLTAVAFILIGLAFTLVMLLPTYYDLRAYRERRRLDQDWDWALCLERTRELEASVLEGDTAR